MAPTPSPTLDHSSNSPSGRRLHHLRRQAFVFPHHPPGQPSASRAEQFKPRTPDPTLQPSLALEGPTPPSFAPMPSQSDVLASEPSTAPVGGNQPQTPSQSGDIPGNIVVAIVVMVLILGGLIGLIIGGQVLRREAKTADPTPSGCVGRRKRKSTKDVTTQPQQRTKMDSEKFPCDEKTLTLLTRPPPVLNRERQRKFSDVWPIRNLSRVLCNRRSSEQDARSRRQATPVANPATTWSEFSPVSLYAATPRTLLSRIPEEHEEDCQSQTHGDFGVDVLHQLLEYSPVMASQSARDSPHEPGCVAAERRNMSGIRVKDEDAKSLGSTAPDMTADGGESSRSSTVSLESLEDGRVKEEVFELRRVQTRSMQMNKGVLLSVKSLPGSGTEPRPASTVGGDELSLAMLGASFSAVDLDEFPSPPSVLPMIPSFVSGF